MTISRQYLQSFHDAEFGTLSAHREAETVALLLHRDDGTRAGFSFDGVRMLRASAFLRQNVVSRILLSSVNPDRFEIGDIVKWAYTVDGRVCLTEAASMTSCSNSRRPSFISSTSTHPWAVKSP